MSGWGLAMIIVFLGVILAFVIFYKWISKKVVNRKRLAFYFALKGSDNMRMHT